LQEFVQRHAPPAFPGSMHRSQQNHLLGHLRLPRRRALTGIRIAW
jgi:hypothetical protein